MTDKAQDYINSIVEKRGYVLKYHKILAKNDFEVMEAANTVVNAAYLKQRTLSKKTKELIFVASLVVSRAPKPQIQSHIQVGLDLGLSPQELLEAIEIALPEAGIVAFQVGVEAWAEVVDAELLEPTIVTNDFTSN